MLPILYNFNRNFLGIFEKSGKLCTTILRVLVTVIDSVREYSDRQTDLSTL
jgi:hypothetical protein